MALGELKGETMVRVHSECLTGDVLGSMRCDCGDQLSLALSEIEDAGSGVIIYLREQEGRGIGLSEKIRAYKLQDEGLDTVEANLALGHEIDERDYQDAVEIIKDLGINSVLLLTNNPNKERALVKAGIQVQIKGAKVKPNQHNLDYLRVKAERMGHLHIGNEA